MLRENAKKIVKKTTALLVVGAVFFVAKKVLAQQDLGINTLADAGVQLGQTDIRVIVGRIVQIFLGLLGTIAIILIIYGGWLYMSSAGNPEQIGRAKKVIINAVIGLLIILSSLAISQFIIGALQGATGGIGQVASPGSYSQPLSGSLGAGIISHHIPERGARAPRNTKIAITFKEAIDEKTIIEDTDKSGTYGDNNDQADTKVFKMTQTSILKNNNNNFKNIKDSDLMVLTAKFAPDKKSFVFAPNKLLGNPTETVSYTILITSDLKKADGSDAFSGSFKGGYQWEFQIEPKIDTTPPTLTSIIPSQGINPRNMIVQLNFSESLDPTSSSGDYGTAGGFQNITLTTSSGTINGSYRVANAYKTIEFLTNDLCGTNSCGGDVYCLPSKSLITGLVKAASVGAEPPQATGFPYDGIVDLAGNSFDGNNDGIASGSQSQTNMPAYKWIGGNAAVQGDDLTWQFNTSDEIDLTPPKITNISPGISAQNVGIDTPIDITFNKVMSAFTLNNDNLMISYDVPSPYELWYSIKVDALSSDGKPVLAGGAAVNSQASIKHGLFAPSVAGGIQYNYYPIVLSKVKDLTQNCYNPSAGPSCVPTVAAPYCCNGMPSATKCNYIP